jgi:hypothetical protein
MAKIVNSSGVMKARIINPGQGSSGYYTESLLKSIAPKFDGVQVFWDHATEAEEAARPERSLRDLAGKVLPGTSKWESEGTHGPGVYADVQVYKPYQEAVNELGPDIGLSISASGSGKAGVVGGKKTVVVESISRVNSVDFVTLPGRGGKPLELFEAARAAGRAAGLREAASTKTDCADCGGTGDCATCKGTGKVAKKTGMGKEAARTMTECTDCQGSGDCATCAGDGTVMESARGATDTGETMDETTLKLLLSEAVAPLQTKIAELDTKLVEAQSQTQPLLRRALEAEARNEATAALSDISMREAGKAYVVAECIKNIPVKDGKLDAAVFREAVTAKAKELAPIIGEGAGQVWGMNSAPAALDPKVREAAAAEIKRVREAGVDIFADLMGGDKKAAEAAINKGVIQ